MAVEGALDTKCNMIMYYRPVVHLMNCQMPPCTLLKWLVKGGGGCNSQSGCTVNYGIAEFQSFWLKVALQIYFTKKKKLK